MISSRKETFFTVREITYRIDNLPSSLARVASFSNIVWFITDEGLCRQVKNRFTAIKKGTYFINQLFETAAEMLTHEDPVVQKWGFKKLKEEK